jgi:uncharacterized membrane protein
MQLPLKSQNIIVILIGVIIIAVGYFLMYGEKFIDATQFSLALKVSPVLIILGHLVVVAGIVVRFGKNSDSKTSGSEAA